MAHVIRMPKLSDTMEDGGIAEWLKAEGDKVDEGEALLMIETDKATMEYPSPESGFLIKILKQTGDSVDLNVPIAVLGAQGESFDSSLLENETTTPTTTQQEPSNSSDQTTPVTIAHEITASVAGRTIASPLARKIAAEKGLSLETIQGSGPRGRIIVRDLEHQQPVKASQNSLSEGSGLEFEDIPVNRMRKTIAQRLLSAKNDAPHFYLTTSIDMTACQEWRQQLNKDESQPRVSINDLVMFATAKALIKHPQVNASWQGDLIRQHHQAHISMAVALPDGLVTPVIRNADRMGIRGIAQNSKALGKKAKNGQLVPDDYQGGTFTVSNLGMTRVDEFTAIINPPQACILAVGRIVTTPTCDSEGNLCCTPLMKVTLSCDHRVVDGMVGAQFLETLGSFLEQPLSLLE